MVDDGYGADLACWDVSAGAECVFQLQDVRNAVLRLQSEKRRKRVRLPPPTLSLSPSSSPGGPSDTSADTFGYDTLLAGGRSVGVGKSDAGSDEEDDELDENSTDAHQRRANKRPLRMIGGVSELAAAVPREERIALSRLEVFLDSGFCFALSHQYVGVSLFASM